MESGIKTPLDQAILQHGNPNITPWRKIDEVPFDFERRRVSVLAERDSQRVLIVKGAPEDVLKCSVSYETPKGEIFPLDAHTLKFFNDKFESMGEEGLRVLGVAFCEVSSVNSSAMVTDETELVFAGFLAFLDPPKESAAVALNHLAKAGIGIKIISGDNERVTAHVCHMLGLTAGTYLTGEILSTLNDGTLLSRVDSTFAFCRVTPQQKSRIIGILKQRGHTVGFLGDGINDAAALHVADVGISINSATDVAKQAADIILLEQDLSIIHAAVKEGRSTVVNVSKYILMAISANFGNMVSMAGGTPVLPFLPMLPLQILLGNLIYDFAQTGLPFDRVDPKMVAKPIHWDIRLIRRFMLIIGPLASLFDFLTFYLLLRWFGPDETYFHTGWFVESLAPQMLTIFSIRTRGWIFSSWPHPIVSMLAFGMSAIIIILPFTTLGAWIGLVPLPPLFFLFILAVTIGYLALLEAVKMWFYHRFGQS